VKDKSYQDQNNMNFGVIEEEDKYCYDNSLGSSYGSNSMNFVSGHVPHVQAFELETEGGGFGEFPSHTLVDNSEKKQTFIGTNEDRDSKGIGGLLELASTKYIMDQIGEEGE
jgi:hypothetical protein